MELNSLFLREKQGILARLVLKRCPEQQLLVERGGSDFFVG
jgi:hypothetical protein